MSQVVAHQRNNPLADGVGRVNSSQKQRRQAAPGLLVPRRHNAHSSGFFRPLCRGRFAKVMSQDGQGEHDSRLTIGIPPLRQFDHRVAAMAGVNEHIPLGVPLRLLRGAHQRLNLGEVFAPA